MDGYTILRTSTVSWLLEHYRRCETKTPPTKDVVEDLRGEVLATIKAPRPEIDRIRAAGPILTLDQHIELLADDEELDLPKDKSGGQFWRIVAQVVHTMLLNEAEAIFKLMGVSNDVER